MMMQFLAEHQSAQSLDKNQFKRRFPQGKKKADFLLFDSKVICEHKEIMPIKMEARVEKLWKKGRLPNEVFERELYGSLLTKLREADEQIRSTKAVLNLPRGLGLVILENAVPEVMSGPQLMGAANSAMLEGLPDIDCAVCLDLINSYRRTEDGKIFHFARTVRRPGWRAGRLCNLIDPLLKEFCQKRGAPFVETGPIRKCKLSWIVDEDGKFFAHKTDFG